MGAICIAYAMPWQCHRNLAVAIHIYAMNRSAPILISYCDETCILFIILRRLVILIFFYARTLPPYAINILWHPGLHHQYATNTMSMCSRCENNALPFPCMLLINYEPAPAILYIMQWICKRYAINYAINVLPTYHQYAINLPCHPAIRCEQTTHHTLMRYQ